MKCTQCGSRMKKGDIELEDSGIAVKGLICPSCFHTEFEKGEVADALNEYRHYLKTKEPKLKLKRKITNLGGSKRGFYFPNDLTESLDIKAGEEIYVYPISKKLIAIERT